MRASEADIPKLTNVTVAGVPALKIEQKSSTNYWAETGKFAVAAGELSVLEDILNRLAGKSSATGLADSSAFQEARPLLAGGILEFFINVSQLSELVADSAGTNPQLKGLVKALNLDSPSPVAGHLSLEGPRTRPGCCSGDTRPGSWFDLGPMAS
jgi:hypothetical protein